jgi:hypothetical protein
MLWITDGELVGVFGAVLGELASKYVFTNNPVVRDGKYGVVRAPVALTEQMARAILTGIDANTRTGGELKGGSLAARLPKVSAASIGLAA